jgi:hypothetical protein
MATTDHIDKSNATVGHNNKGFGISGAERTGLGKFVGE